MSARMPLAEVDAHIDVLDRAEPTQNQMYWRRAFDALNTALSSARKIRTLLIPPTAIVAVVLLWLLHGDTWELNDIRTGFGLFVIVLALGHLALGAAFAPLRREARIASLLRYYGASDVAEDGAIL